MEPSSFMKGLLSWGRNVAEGGDSHDFHNGGGWPGSPTPPFLLPVAGNEPLIFYRF